MSRSPMAPRPKAAPWARPKTSGWATTNPGTFSSEAALEEELGGVLAFAAVGLQHVHRGAAEARLRVVDVGIDARVEALAVDGRDEGLAHNVLPRRCQHGGEPLLCPPQGDADVAARLAVVLLVGLLVGGVDRVDLVDARERREEARTVRDRAARDVGRVVET